MDAADHTRRDFLTGRSLQKQLSAAGDRLADALVEALPPVASDTIRIETRAMACSWCVVLDPGPPRQFMVASDALDLVHEVEDLLTVYRDNSVVAQLNATAAEEPQPIPADLGRLLQTCVDLWEQTEGGFDVATGALIGLWRERRQSGSIPSTEEIQATLERCGTGHLRLTAPGERGDDASATLQFDVPGLLLDFGAIGKGEAIDRAAAHLRHESLTNFLVHGGHSSLRAQGRHHDLAGWPIGLKNPLLNHQRYATVLLRDRAMSTSGSNVQFFRYQGEQYGHILDPRSGWPASELLSVTTFAPTAAEADALSTAFYVMGLDKTLRYCHDRKEIGAIVVPRPVNTRMLEPVVVNFPEEDFFWEAESGAARFDSP